MQTSSKDPRPIQSIAIVGGGIAGACAAAQLYQNYQNTLQIHVFDQGRRGPGGRASHRTVRPSDGSVVLPKEEAAEVGKDLLEFDHGCQFFRADSLIMKEKLLPQWLKHNDWVAPWKARIGCLGRQGVVATNKESSMHDFFGLPSSPEPVYLGVGGMHQLPRKIMADLPIHLRAGTRVSGVRPAANGTQWELIGMSDEAAYHDTTVDAEPSVLVTVDAVVFTDMSSASDAWHRASAGIPKALLEQLPDKVRMPMFSCMVALDYPVADKVPLDGFTVSNDTEGAQSILWFASRSQSKPGIAATPLECWTLVSTPEYALSQIRKTTMRDPETGEFRPQQDGYLQSIPGPDLFQAFLDAIRPYLGDLELPKAVYMQAQRWGTGLPIPRSMAKNVEEIVGDEFISELNAPLVRPWGTNEGKNDFVADDKLRLYYAGDFCATWNPGFEAAALSGYHVAEHILKTLSKD